MSFEETDGELLRRMGTDAEVWAREFVARCPGARGFDPSPGSTLHGWFCNAIEAGRGAGYADARRDAAKLFSDIERAQAEAGVRDYEDAVEGRPPPSRETT